MPRPGGTASGSLFNHRCNDLVGDARGFQHDEIIGRSRVGARLGINGGNEDILAEPGFGHFNDRAVVERGLSQSDGRKDRQNDGK